MSEFYHGVRTRQQETSASAPITAASGIPFVVGTAPVHTVGGKVNTPVLCNSYSEAVAALGYSDDWEKYTLCEMVYSHFKLYAARPLIVVNVLDPEEHKDMIDQKFPVIGNQCRLPFEACVDSSLRVRSAGEDKTEYAVGTDYAVFYDGDALVVEMIEGGKIPADTAELYVTAKTVNPATVKSGDIIGGFDPATKTCSGFELVDHVFPMYQVAPDLLLAPGWSHYPEVAAVMTAKAEMLNGLFEAKALIDAKSLSGDDYNEVVGHYTDVPAWKEKHKLTSKAAVVLWPMLNLGDRRFHYSTQAAGLMANVDTENGGCPCESASNKKLRADAMVLADGTEVVLDLSQANFLNAAGIVTGLNFIGGLVMWGNYTACYPSGNDVKDYFIPVSRMFGWVAKSLILTYWSKLDRKLNRRLMDSIKDGINIWLNGLVAEEKLLGARVEILEEENPLEDLMAGIIRFHLYITPPSPAQEIDFILEYDPSVIESALMA